MPSYYDLIQSLTSDRVYGASGLIMLNDFAYELGWQPSDPFYAPEVEDLATAHLLVEHGLENTAVLTFLRSPLSYSELDFSVRKDLLRLSYNNLVDWHIFDETGIYIVLWLTERNADEMKFATEKLRLFPAKTVSAKCGDSIRL